MAKPPLIYNSIVRYTYNSTYAGRDVANVMDMAVIPAGATTRPVAIQRVAECLIDAWWDLLNLGPINTGFQTNSLSWVDMNSTSGSTGNTNAGFLHTLPKTGESDGNRMPGNVAYRVNKSILGSRGKRSGRMYLAGVNEEATAKTNPNVLTSAYATDLGGKIATYFNAIDETFTGVVTCYPVVTHTEEQGDPPVIVAAGFSTVTSFLVDTTLGSQRRRLRG